jgi:gamma-glutamyl hercynylcysteine S-oxide synthase
VAVLDTVRERTLALVGHLSDEQLSSVLSPIMSPLVWDLAHIAAYEDLWLAHRHGGLDLLRPDLAELYDAFETPRSARGEIELLGPEQARAYLREVRARAVEALASRGVGDGTVYELVLRHELQHTETMRQTMALVGLLPAGEPRLGPLASTPHVGGHPKGHTLRGTGKQADTLASTGAVAGAPHVGGHPEGHTLRGTPPGAQAGKQADTLAGVPRVGGHPEGHAPWGAGGRAGGQAGRWVDVPGGPFEMGAGPDGFAYDNERPRHTVELPAYEIARHPVSNADWTRFTDGGGYKRREWWSEEGWAWKREENIAQRVGVPGGHPDAAVCHVNWFEADAYARASGARLPIEAEWEKAAARGLLSGVGQVWEWTGSRFDGYPGFVAHPYREYSEVFFGGDYRVLRGGSWATSPRVGTVTFRNWDHPMRSQIFAGVRLAREAMQ